MPRRIMFPRAACALLALVSTSSPSQAIWNAPGANVVESPRAGVFHELRIYEIFESNKKAFHERFRDHAVRLMAKYGFKIVSMWESKFEGRTEFVYLLEWPDRQTMTARWTKFRADQEWIDVKNASAKAHGAVVGEIEDRVLEPTEYSPRTRLLSAK